MLVAVANAFALVGIGLTKATQLSRHLAHLLAVRTGDGDEEMVQDIADDSPDPEQQAVAQDLQRVIAEATGQIPERYREPFVLREVNQLSYEEIAAVTGLKLGTVRSRINRARNHFRKIIEPLLEDPSPSPEAAPADQ